ncbi:putative C2H2 zinc finger domain protein [Aspergillus clavatus NRRL 1]|uniref:C2H2-type domain-containing protein n=1 Tax=Aspergillus clavatus (strain ATCC 1007 / CBS 513.65 / DSM 816 / NCTC 3887 / NRRL 1 / QM 1276 / 107) TaxID=344612 RepID=A1CJG2_ASPCL|nr:uncharacterized protein ACLA_034890 [Aspergillus clavatus NRRL 1]EAW09286.1 hypothetical protein ACLA_034890 [Aspergillus clavatus NRRL 1]
MDSFIFNQNLPNKYPENFPDHISDDTESSPGVLDRDGRVQTLENYLVPGPFFDNFSNYSNSPGYSPVTFSAAASVSGVAPPANNQEDVPGGDLTPAGSALLQSQQWQPTGIVDPGPSQVPLESSNAYLDNLVEFLLIKTAFESIRGLTQDILPRLDDEVSLGSLKTFLQGTFSALDASIQGRLDQIAPTRPVTRDRYRCKLCDTRAGARVYRTLGTFKRHVSHTHRAEHIYLCPFNPCTFNKSTRRDKFGQHLPQTHNFRAWDKKFLDGCRKPCPSPASCDICHAGVSSWKKWFKCVANHCRLPIGAYTATSISLSRRGSGSSGGDGSESGDQQPYGGNGFNGVAPAFGGNHMGGNESIYFNVGQQFGYYHASHSQNKVQAPPGCEPLHGADLPADSHFDSASTTGSETTDSQLSVFRATDLRKHHFGLVSTLEHCPSALDNSRDLTLQQKNSEQSSDHSNRKDIKRILPTPRDRNLQNDSPRDLERSFKVNLSVNTLSRKSGKLAIDQLFKLKTTIANAQNAQNAQNTQTEIQRRQMDSSTASEVILDYPDSSEIIFDVPIVETEEPSTLWDSLQSNARFIKNLVSLARKHCQLEAYDLQSFDTLLGDILPRLLDSWNNPVRTITP